tara:strand:- start:81 stop:746 length:666 start_codon:yes stop_codon:yes gene_type:complete
MKFFIIIKEKSLRVPGKNFLKLGEYPLWRRLVEKLHNHDVFIDTDSDLIIEECRDMGWVTAYRRKKEHIFLETSSDFKVSPVLKMIERFLDEHVIDDSEIIITPHVTSPFITLDTIEDACEKLKYGYDSVLACTEHKEFAYFEGKAINFNPNEVQKTQNLKPIIMSNGAFFIFTKESFKKNKNNRVGGNPYYYVLQTPEDVEIDDYNDLKLAQLINKGLCS